MVKVQNVSGQLIPLIIPSKNGGDSINLHPRETIGLAINTPTTQILRLKESGLIKVR